MEKFLLVTEHWVECAGWVDAQEKLSSIENAVAQLPINAELNLSYAEDDGGERRDTEGDPA